MAVSKAVMEPLMSVEESDKFQGRLLKQEHCIRLFTKDVDVYDKESGKCIAKFRKKVIPANVQRLAYDNLLIAATETDNRPLATVGDTDTPTVYRKRADGSTSSQAVARGKVASGLAGYYDRTSRFPNCRLTAFNRHHLAKFIDAYPIIKLVDNKYKELMPNEYKAQRKIADKTAKDFVIPDTAFTTITINKNYTTAVHKDAGDFKEGFGNLVALRKGTYEGCHFVVVRWGCGFDLQNGDLLLVDVHQWHGNTPMIKHEKDATRLSLVMYYRENMIKCGSMGEELKRIRKIKKGEKTI